MAAEGDNPDKSSSSPKPLSTGKTYLLLGSIVLASCVGFTGSAVLIVIGYRNPGSVALAILGCGTLLFFATVLFLLACCIWMSKKFPTDEPDTGRVPRSTEETAALLPKPLPSGGALIAPPNTTTTTDPNYHKKPRLQGDRPESRPKAPLSRDFTTTPATSALSVENPVSDVHFPGTTDSADITSATAGDPPIDVRIVSHPKKDRSPQEKMPIAPGPGKMATPPSAYLPVTVRPEFHHRQVQDHARKRASAAGSIDTETGDPPMDVRTVSHGKGNQQHEKRPIGTPRPVVTSSAPPTEASVPHHRSQEADHDQSPAAAHSIDSVVAPVMDSSAKTTPISHPEKRRLPQGDKASWPDTKNITITAVGSAAMDGKPALIPNPDPCIQLKNHSVPGSVERPTAFVLHPLTKAKPAPHPKKGCHDHNLADKHLHAIDVISAPDSDPPKQPCHALHQKVQPRNQDIALQVMHPAEFTWSQISGVPTPRSARPAANIKQEHHQTGARTLDNVPGARDPTDGKCSQDSRTPVERLSEKVIHS